MSLVHRKGYSSEWDRLHVLWLSSGRVSILVDRGKQYRVLGSKEEPFFVQMVEGNFEGSYSDGISGIGVSGVDENGRRLDVAIAESKRVPRRRKPTDKVVEEAVEEAVEESTE